MEATGGAQPGGAEGIPGPPLPTLTVAAVARRLGVAPPTLRTWDRRYGLGPSAHTAGAHRRYSPSDVARLMVMRRLTLQGVPPADAARIALATQVAADGGATASITGIGELTPGDPFSARAGGSDTIAAPDPDLDSEDVADAYSESDLSSARRADLAEQDGPGSLRAFDGPWRDEPGTEIETPWLGVLRNRSGDPGAGLSGPSGGGRVVAMPDGNPASRGLARAAMSLDTHEVARLVREGMRRQGVVPAWDGMVVPVLQALGERTRATGDGIDVEHAFSEALLSVLRGVASNVREPRNPAPVLLACAEGDYHSLPLHVLAAALAERDVACRMLGTGLPPHALASAVRRTGPCAVVLYAQNPDADAAATDELRRQRPAPRVVLGGVGWKYDTVPPGVRTAGSLGEAIDEVMLAVHA